MQQVCHGKKPSGTGLLPRGGPTIVHSCWRPHEISAGHSLAAASPGKCAPDAPHKLPCQLLPQGTRGASQHGPTGGAAWTANRRTGSGSRRGRCRLGSSRQQLIGGFAVDQTSIVLPQGRDLHERHATLDPDGSDPAQRRSHQISLNRLRAVLLVQGLDQSRSQPQVGSSLHGVEGRIGSCQIARLGKLLEQLSQQPRQERGKEVGAQEPLVRCQNEHCLSCGIRAHEIGQRQGRLPETLLGPCSSQASNRRWIATTLAPDTWP